MKIAFVLNKFPLLSETFILNQITGLIDLGHEVDIYANQIGDISKIHPDVDKYHLLKRTFYIGRPKNRIGKLSKIIVLLITKFFLNPIVFLKSINITKYGDLASNLVLFYATGYLVGKEAKYDIIHCHFGPNGLKSAFLRDIGVISGKLISTFHGYDITNYLEEKGERVYDPLFKLGDLFLPISESWKIRLEKLGCTKKILVHRMGIDCNKFTFSVHENPNNDRIRIVSIARLVEKKGIEYGIRAVAKLLIKKSNITYTIVGDGLLRENLEILIDELGIGEQVNLVGWKHQEEVVSILKDSDLMLAPSITSKNGDCEGVPVVLMEAMAMGLVIVSTQHSGIPELVKDGITGFLVPEKDVESLAERMEYLINHPTIRLGMGKAGRKQVEENYNINKLNYQLAGIYEALL
ncbi:glycosyltransferase [Mastigocoleus sp. MO_188.B34]|uniref:glycosyltransferase n=1 Tax=Mastigocoleus sp. MO_188.B34 TaxID=3036635 RepID=UPI00262C396B|nr:glycosyltransferase [Mastigocoleus sp. MO_188.B34]MDJ0696718.1 glycosyltransferase [Mastigocoleus sp. MO_188.B34]